MANGSHEVQVPKRRYVLQVPRVLEVAASTSIRWGRLDISKLNAINQESNLFHDL